MSRYKTITYMISPDGHIYSRVGSQIAIPVLDFAGMKPENNYVTNYSLEKFEALSCASDINNSIHTRKIPVEMKNLHRKFWGMKPIKELRKR